MTRRVDEIGKALGVLTIGDGGIEIRGIASIPAAQPGDLVFVQEEKHLQSALLSNAAAIVAGAFAQSAYTSKALLITSNPRLAFARAAKFLHTQESYTPGIHPTAIVDPSAALGKDVAIDARAVVYEGVLIGDCTWIGAGVVIGKASAIGEDCEIYPNVTIYSGTRIGDRVIVHAGAVLGSDGFGYVHDDAELPDAAIPARQSGRYEKFPQIGKLLIEDDVEIGANATIDRGALETTRIGRGTKIDNLVHIGHNCQIGENVIIAAQAGFSGSITIENNVVIGGQVGVGEHARIEEGVMLGGQAGVLPKKILRGRGIAFWGTPAKPLREYLKQLAAITKLGRRA